MIWLPVVGFEGRYEVSDSGLVKSLFPRRSTTPIILTPQTRKRYGHQKICLQVAGRKRHTEVHRVVAEAFLGLPAPGQIACHINGDPADNRLENIRWGTYAENSQDMVRHGNSANARKTHCQEGHPLGPYVGKPRRCKPCNKAAVARYQARRKGVIVDPDIEPDWPDPT